MARNNTIINLQSQLLASGIQQKNPALYQTINGLITAAQKNQDAVDASINNIDILLQSLTYITSSDESANLPNSRQLIAGSNITIDDSVPNQLTISSSGSAGSRVSLLTDGNEIETQLIFANGDVIMVDLP